MGSIFGFTGKDLGIQKMNSKLKHWNPNRENIVQSDSYSNGALELFKTPECHLTPQPLQIRNLTISFDGRIDNRKELSESLSLSEEGHNADIEFIHSAYLKWGKGCVKHLIGDFAFSVWDENSDELFLTRDHFGVKPIFYSIYKEQIIFSSEIKGILAINDFKPITNERYIAAQFSGLQLQRSETIYSNVKSIPYGCYLTFKNGELNVNRYWDLGMNNIPIPSNPDNQFKEFERLFNQSVSKRLRRVGNIGAEISGGLDSTGIGAVAMEHLGNGYPFYGYCFGKASKTEEEFASKDDSELAKEFCIQYGIQANLTVVNELDLSAEDYIKYNHQIIDDLENNGVPLFSTSFLPKAKKQELNVMLSGWAGDQVVTNTCGGFYEAKANKGMTLSLWKELKTNNSFIKACLKLALYIAKSIFKPTKKRNKKVGIKRINDLKLEEKFIKKNELLNILPSRYYLKGCTNIQAYQKANLLHPAVLQRVVNHGLIGKHFGIDYRFPMLDLRLIEYLHCLPFSTVAPKGKTRYLFKKLMKGKIPNGVINLHKSFVATTPFAMEFFIKNKNYINEIWDECEKENISKFFSEHNADPRVTLKKIQLSEKLAFI